METPKINTILIVDDTTTNIDILVDLLNSDYHLSVATTGQQALESVKNNIPDLILLDIMMPQMDGYEVCRRLKANPRTNNIPILFLTALSDNINETKGLEYGAVDYIAKPFEPAILHARIRTHLNLQNARSQLQKFNSQLANMVKEKSQQLAHAHERLKLLDAAKNDFLSAISHELRTPANGVLGVAQLALFSMQNPKERQELQDVFDESSERLLTTIDNALLLAQLQTTNAQLETIPFHIDVVIQDAINITRLDAQKKHVTIQNQRPPTTKVKCVEQLTQQAVATILKTTIQLSNENEQVLIEYATSESTLDVYIQSHGKTLPEDTLSSIFNIFSNKRASSYLEQMGLELPLAAKIISAMEGSVSIKNTDPQHILIKLTLPIAA